MPGVLEGRKAGYGLHPDLKLGQRARKVCGRKRERARTSCAAVWHTEQTSKSQPREQRKAVPRRRQPGPFTSQVLDARRSRRSSCLGPQREGGSHARLAPQREGGA